MEPNNFNLLEILRELKSKRKFIIFLTTLSIIIAAIFVAIRPKVYNSSASFIVKSAMNQDRRNMYGEKTGDNKEFYATDKEIDKVLSVLKSYDIFDSLNKAIDFKTLYGTKSQIEIDGKIKKNFKVTRTDNNDIQIEFSDKNPQIAFQAVNIIYNKAEDIYKQIFMSHNADLTKDIDSKLVAINDSINNFELQIAEIRKTYNLNTALLPVRGESLAPNTNGGNPEGLEKLANAIAFKDKMVAQKAQFYILKQEYANNKDRNTQIRSFFMVSNPGIPDEPANSSAMMVILGSAITAFLVACLTIILIGGYKRI